MPSYVNPSRSGTARLLVFSRPARISIRWRPNSSNPMSINPTGACDVTAPLMARSDPVADLCGDPEGVREQPDAAHELGALPQASTTESSWFGRDRREPRSLVFDGLRIANERHPLAETIALGSGLSVPALATLPRGSRRSPGRGTRRGFGRRPAARPPDASP